MHGRRIAAIAVATAVTASASWCLSSARTHALSGAGPATAKPTSVSPIVRLEACESNTSPLAVLPGWGDIISICGNGPSSTSSWFIHNITNDKVVRVTVPRSGEASLIDPGWKIPQNVLLQPAGTDPNQVVLIPPTGVARVDHSPHVWTLVDPDATTEGSVATSLVSLAGLTKVVDPSFAFRQCVQGIRNGDDIKTYIQTTVACATAYGELRLAAKAAAAVLPSDLTPEFLGRLRSLPEPVIEIPENASKGLDLAELFKVGVEHF
jgi:hypothetical protein